MKFIVKLIFTFLAIFASVKCGPGSGVPPGFAFAANTLDEHLNFLNLANTITALPLNNQGQVDSTNPVSNLPRLSHYAEHLDWKKVKQNWNEGDKLNMRKFLHLRMIDLKYMINYVLNSHPDVFRYCAGKNSFAEITGTFGSFLSDCVRVKVSDVGPEDVAFKSGKFEFRSGGSQSTSSDIDASIDFLPENNVVLNAFGKLKAVVTFIELYHLDFIQIHKSNSLAVYDVNLYSGDFKYEELTAEIIRMKNTQIEDFRIFKAVNRLSVMLLIYNDSLNMFHKKNIQTRIQREATKLQTLYQQSQSSNKDCGIFLLTTHTGAQKPLDAVRELDNDSRNRSMVHYIKQASNHTPEQSPLRNLCQLIAANYFALEAYVPFTSIYDMLTLQPIMPINTFAQQNKDFVLNLDEDGKIDALLMNFAYAVEHHYEISGRSAIEKFAKYIARMYRLVRMMTNANHKRCWEQAFNKLNLGNLDGVNNNITNQNRDIAYEQVNQLKGKIIQKLLGEQTKDVIITTFVVDGYQCVNQFGFTINNARKKRKLKK